MRRALLILLAALVAGVAGVAVWLLFPGSPAEARFDHSQCRRLALTDAETGATLTGIEDIASYGGDLFLSAQDRTAAEAAAQTGQTAPEGGIYRLPEGLLPRPGPHRMIPQATGLPTALHPHGIDASLAKLVAINRRYGPEGAEGHEMLVFAIREDHLEKLHRLPNPDLCAANDLVLTGGAVKLSLDRAACPGIDPWEQASGGATGRLMTMGVSDFSSGGMRELIGEMTFPNGVGRIERDGVDLIAVAETRANRITLVDNTLGSDYGRRGEIVLPGGPDNLTKAPDGRLVAALHPSLIRLALYRFGWWEAAPSRVVALDAEGRTEWLLDDPSGALFSAATVGVLTESGHLVAGSVREEGLLVCDPA
ncbi:MAG: hypothetical protein AAFU49_09335 [Pseudomonadota bacterium]